MPPPEECQLFNMEMAVTTLRTMFQKAESDMDCIQAMLEFEIKEELPTGLSQEENPLVIVQRLSELKFCYKVLCEQLEKISIERQESMRSISTTLAKTVKLIQEIQQHAGTEISPLPEEEQLAIQHLTCRFSEITDSLPKQISPEECENH